MIAAIILACAEHISMIVIGRVFQGVAVSSCHALFFTYVAADTVSPLVTSRPRIATMFLACMLENCCRCTSVKTVLTH